MTILIILLALTDILGIGLVIYYTHGLWKMRKGNKQDDYTRVK